MIMSSDNKKIGDMLLVVGGRPVPKKGAVTKDGFEGLDDTDCELAKIAAEDFMEAVRGNDPMRVIKTFARLQRICPEYMHPSTDSVEIDD